MQNCTLDLDPSVPHLFVTQYRYGMFYPAAAILKYKPIGSVVFNVESIHGAVGKSSGLNLSTLDFKPINSAISEACRRPATGLYSGSLHKPMRI